MLSTTSLHSLSFFFNDTATTEIYTLSLHDALPICAQTPEAGKRKLFFANPWGMAFTTQSNAGSAYVVSAASDVGRSEEHTSELQSLTNLVCRLLLEKKNKKKHKIIIK